MIGQLLPFDLEGIDFCMTALFVIIFMDQWEKSKNHFPAVAGLIIAVLCLFVFGQMAFMLPALILASGILMFWSGKKRKKAVGEYVGSFICDSSLCYDNFWTSAASFSDIPK